MLKKRIGLSTNVMVMVGRCTVEFEFDCALSIGTPSRSSLILGEAFGINEERIYTG